MLVDSLLQKLLDPQRQLDVEFEFKADLNQLFRGLRILINKVQHFNNEIDVIIGVSSGNLNTSKMDLNSEQIENRIPRYPDHRWKILG